MGCLTIHHTQLPSHIKLSNPWITIIIRMKNSLSARVREAQYLACDLRLRLSLPILLINSMLLIPRICAMSSYVLKFFIAET